MKIVVSNIDWDYDDDQHPENLPTTVTIDDPALIPHLAEDIDGEAENLAEYLSDKYGYCLRGFVTELKKEDES